jgi:hypothetical protein
MMSDGCATRISPVVSEILLLGQAVRLLRLTVSPLAAFSTAYRNVALLGPTPVTASPSQLSTTQFVAANDANGEDKAKTEARQTAKGRRRFPASVLE